MKQESADREADSPVACQAPAGQGAGERVLPVTVGDQGSPETRADGEHPLLDDQASATDLQGMPPHHTHPTGPSPALNWPSPSGAWHWFISALSGHATRSHSLLANNCGSLCAVPTLAGISGPLLLIGHLGTVQGHSQCAMSWLGLSLVQTRHRSDCPGRNQRVH
ncbi:unnamed protein product [Eretmochelys imbricata]